MIYLQLFYEFFQIGLFAIGGGMATIPFLYHLSEKTGWYDISLISDMVAISESTPGPIGINMATYVGYSVGGIVGGVISSVAITIPSLIIVVIVSKSLAKFNHNQSVKNAFYGLRPAVTGLIAAAGFTIMQQAILTTTNFSNIDGFIGMLYWDRLFYFAALWIVIRKWKKHPVVYIMLSAVVGILFAF